MYFLEQSIRRDIFLLWREVAIYSILLGSCLGIVQVLYWILTNWLGLPSWFLILVCESLNLCIRMPCQVLLLVANLTLTQHFVLPQFREWIQSIGPDSLSRSSHDRPITVTQILAEEVIRTPALTLLSLAFMSLFSMLSPFLPYWPNIIISTSGLGLLHGKYIFEVPWTEYKWSLQVKDYWADTHIPFLVGFGLWLAAAQLWMQYFWKGIPMECLFIITGPFWSMLAAQSHYLVKEAPIIVQQRVIAEHVGFFGFWHSCVALLLRVFLPPILHTAAWWMRYM